MQFSWYGLIIGLGFSMSIWFLDRIFHSEKVGKISDRTWLIGGMLVFLSSLVGARAYHLITDWPLYAHQPWTTWVATWNGGLGIFGGLLGGAFGATLWHHFFLRSHTHLSRWMLFDALAIVMPLGQAMGRFGNFLNHELFGPPTTLPWGIFIPEAFRPLEYIDATHFHPLFLYEALPNFVLFLGLFSLWRWQKNHPELSFVRLGSGLYIALYALTYGTVRFTLDFARWDLTLFGPFALSQWLSLALIGIAFYAFVRFSKNTARTEPTEIRFHLKKSAQRILFLAIGTGLLFSFFHTTVSAQNSSEFDLTVQPSVVELSIQPGRRVTQAFELRNAGTADLEVTLTLRDFISDNHSGNPVLLETNSFPYAELQNAQIALGQPFLLSADSTQQIVVALDIPADALTRDWYFTLLAETQTPADPGVIGSGTATTGTIGTNVLVRVTPTEFLPTEWSLDLKGIPQFIDSLQSITIEPWVTNESTSLANPDISILILDWRDRIVYEGAGLPERVLAQSTRQISASKQRVDDPRSYEAVPFTFDPLFALGPYTVRATIRNDSAGPLVVEEQFWAFPFTLVSVIAGGSLLLWGVRRQRKQQAHRRDTTEAALKRVIP